jgi:hypothetical protein
LFRKRGRVRFITLRQSRRHGRDSPSRAVRRQADLLRDGQCPGNRFSKGPVRLLVCPVRGHHCAQASGVPCIPHGKGRRVRGRWELDQDFLRRDRPVQAAVPVVQRAGQDSVTFLAE